MSTINKSVSQIPDLSVIIVIVSDSRHLERCLKSLSEQIDPPFMEIIVPYEEGTIGISALKNQFLNVYFYRVTGIKPLRNCGRPRHEHLDKMRSIGLTLAKGRIVALLEDHDRLDRYWSMEVSKSHQAYYAVIGGAVENEVNRPLNWAVYFCDFGRYQNPLKEGPSRFLSDVNISYKKTALDKVKEIWCDFYHEPFVNNALRAKGETLWLSPKIIVYQHRKNLKLNSALRERIDWGRYYAGNRVRKFETSKRLFYTVFFPFLPFLLLTRMTCIVILKKRLDHNFIKALSFLIPLTTFWSFGEFLGYLTAKPTSVSKSHI